MASTELNQVYTQTLDRILSPHLGPFGSKLAINDGITRLSYEEIEGCAERIAWHMVRNGIRRGDRVCLIADKCSEIIPFAIAAWKAGAIYSPLDPELPQARLDAILAKLRPKALVATKSRHGKVRADYVLRYDLGSCRGFAETEACPLAPVADGDVAIIIHTSGSTGLPKGVQLTHASVVAYFQSHRHIFGLNKEFRCLNTASFHYDVSIQDTFMPLFFGAYVYLCRSIFAPKVVLPLIERERFTQITAVSTVLSMITGDHANLEGYDLSSLRIISTGAEVCSVKLIHAWLARLPGLKVVNGYGPSEVNSVTLSYVIDRSDPGRTAFYPIGRPHAGVLCRLVDDALVEIRDPGVKGKLLLGGPQLMKGYWENEEATRAAFCELDGERYYQTGDICHYDGEGQLVFDGRSDFEVKINGRRMNLHELKEIIQKHTPYSEVVVGTVARKGSTAIAVIVRHPEDWEEFRLPALKELLQNHFPKYMLPSVYGVYPDAVQTGSGKTDERHLLARLEQALALGGADELYALQEGNFVSRRAALAAAGEGRSHA